MGNRAWLYLESESAGQTDSEHIASSNNNLPTLWQILLAGADSATADTSQRVFGDAGSEGLRVSAQAAPARLRELASFLIERAPLKAALYCRQLEGAVLWLEQLLDAQGQDTQYWFSANLDELSWLYEGDPADFAEAVSLASSERWQALRHAMAAGDLPAVLERLNVSDDEDDDGWAWRFGLAGLEHPFFAERYEPLDMSFVEFQAEAALDDAHLGHGLYAFEEHSLWGIRRGRTPGSPVLVAPQFERLWPFEDTLAAVMKHGKCGLIDTHGREVLACVLDGIWDYAQGLAGAEVDGLIGFIDTQGGWAIAPRFEAIGNFSPAHQAPACIEGLWGVIDRQGNWRVAPVWDDIGWNDELYAWEPERDGHKGLIDVRARQVLGTLHEVIELYDHHVEAAEQWAAGTLRMVAGSEDKLGLVDGDGQQLVPMSYSHVGALTWLPRRLGDKATPAPAGEESRYVHVRQRVEHDDWEQWLQTVYDTRSGRELLPQVHEVCGLRWNSNYGWLCVLAPEAPGAYCTDGLYIGIAHADGRWMHEPVYAWIGHQRDALSGAADLVEHWNRSTPITAQHAESGALWLLHADGRVEPAEEHAGTFDA